MRPVRTFFSLITHMRRTKMRCDWVERQLSQGHQPVLVHLTEPVILLLHSSGHNYPSLTHCYLVVVVFVLVVWVLVFTTLHAVQAHKQTPLNAESTQTHRHGREKKNKEFSGDVRRSWVERRNNSNCWWGRLVMDYYTTTALPHRPGERERERRRRGGVL